MASGNGQLARYHQIAEALARHGLGYLTGTLGLDRFVPFHRGLLGHARRDEPYTRPEHVRLALGELGATFIKLGQVLSTRADLLPPDYQVELAKLQDDAPAVPVEAVRDAIAAELGRPVEQVFAAFDPAPLAAASIGQAHAAVLADGTEVVVKVRRPGVVEQVERDLEILRNLATTASRRWAVAEQYDLVGLVQEFAETIRAELDYLREGRNAERIAASFTDDPGVHVPRVVWDATTSRVITLERVRGIKISDVAALDAAGIDRKALARRAAAMLVKMVFEDGFFHADPHPGNFFIEPGGRIGLIDFGMVGTVDGPTRERLAGVLLAITRRDGAMLADALLDLGFARRRVERGLLARDLGHLLSRYADRPLAEVPIAGILGEAQAILREHRLLLPSNFALLLKTLAMSEGVGARLDPEFRLTEVLAPHAERLVQQQYAPLRLAGRLAEAGLEAARLGSDLPQQLRRLVSQLEQGHAEFTLRESSFEAPLRGLERLANRIVLGVLAAAFINGLAMLVSAYPPAGFERWAGAFLAFGLAIAAALGGYLAWSILRPGKRSGR